MGIRTPTCLCCGTRAASFATGREYTEGVKRTVVAFANTDGGTLYLGIDDNGELCGLTPLAQKGRLVRRDVQAALGDSQATAALLLRYMEKGLIRKTGAGRSSEYVKEAT